MDACLYGDVAQWIERGKLINLRGRGFESFHLHDYIATPYSSKTRSSNILLVQKQTFTTSYGLRALNGRQI